MESEVLYKKTLISDMREIKIVLDEILLVATRKYGEKIAGKIRVVLSELVINAYNHGNLRDINKKIYIEIKIESENEVLISVRDEGKGIKEGIITLKKQDVKERRAFLDENGRGLMLIIGLSKEVTIEKNGTKICALIMTK